MRALNKAGDIDTKRAATDAARDLLPYVKANTREDTGRLKSGWRVDDGAFINDVEYAPFQEFGTVSVDPTYATFKAFEEHEEVAVKAFEKEQERAAKQAGFGR